MGYWTGKVALVTGGSAGLGRAIAAELVKRGARVAVAARGSEQLERTAAQLRTDGANLLPIVADVTQDADVVRMLQQVLTRFGRLDLLVNNAGQSMRGELTATTPEQFRQSLEINLIATVRVTRLAAPYLLATKGHVVNIGSLAGKSAACYLGAYPAAKFALAGYTQQLRLELGPKGLNVLLVCPGPIARDEPRQYVPAGSPLPAKAKAPGGGVKLSGLKPERLAAAILRAAQRKRPELVLPRKARLLFVLNQMSPRLGDWLVRKMT